MVRIMDVLNERVGRCVCRLMVAGAARLRDRRGQGTTEYAILVGVLVVIAIIAVVAFRGKLQELWSAISEGVNSL
jgi:Flp pilus assembly pilin Flp